MKTWNEYKAEQLQNPEVKKEYDALALEFALISARQEAGMSQQELSQLAGVTQADISKIENGKGNPSIKTLQKLAAALHKTLRIEFA
jgi:DNA-binding XRE family transcriptional regulator